MSALLSAAVVAVQAAAAPRHFRRVAHRTFFIDCHRDTSAVDRERRSQEGVRRAGKRRMVIVLTDGTQLADVGSVDDAHAAVPTGGP